MTDADDRLARGEALLKAMHGARGEAAMESLRDVAPELADLVATHAFADLYDRPGLELKTRQICTVAALIVMADAPAQLEVHMRAALRLGWTRAELVELVMQMSAYAGFPAALKAVAALRAALIMQAEDEAQAAPTGQR
jgi:4-carboxymuconolactone decarboxylase